MGECVHLDASKSAARTIGRAGFAVCAWGCALLLADSAFGQSEPAVTIAIVRPAPGGAYDKAFDEIVAGAQSAGALIAVEIPVDSYAPTELGGKLADIEPDVVMTLGLQADATYRASGAQYPQIVGATDIAPGAGANGVSLTSDPVFLLTRAKALMPEKRRVVVVYDERADRWLLDRAKRISRNLGLELVAHPASSLTEASNQYWNVLRYGNPDTDILWLLSRPSFVNDSNLPRLVEESWRRRFAIISNDIDHARRGVLLATYPDLEEMGRQLAETSLVVAADASHKSRGVEPLGAVKFAINRRFADHLGLALSPQHEGSFDLILGEERRP